MLRPIWAYIFTSNEPLTLLNWFGVLLASAGVLLEYVSDNQLHRFKQTVENKGVLSTGIWNTGILITWEKFCFGGDCIWCQLILSHHGI